MWACLIGGVGVVMSLISALLASTSFGHVGEHLGEALVFLLQVSAITGLPAFAAGCAAALIAGNEDSIDVTYVIAMILATVGTPLILVISHWHQPFSSWGGSGEGPPLWSWIVTPAIMCVIHIVFLVQCRLARADRPTFC